MIPASVILPLLAERFHQVLLTLNCNSGPSEVIMMPEVSSSHRYPILFVRIASRISPNSLRSRGFCFLRMIQDYYIY